MPNGIASTVTLATQSASAPPTASCNRHCCPACGGSLIEIRAKLQCTRCHTICETCCEGGRG